MYRLRSGLILIVAATLVLPACAADKGAQRRALGGDKPIKVTLSNSDIKFTQKVTAGAVEFNFVSLVDEGDLEITKLKRKVDEVAFKEGIAPVLAGGPFPDFVESTAGIASDGQGTVSETLVLEPGNYMMWAAPVVEPDEDDITTTLIVTTTTAAPVEGEAPGGGPSVDALVATPLTVFASEPGQELELPDNDGTITARDYTFDVDVKQGEEYTFMNDGPDQYHHVVLFDFDDIKPDVVEENLVAFLERDEKEPLPAALKDVDLDRVEIGGSGVFGPKGGGGTFSVDLSKGNTYAAVCFISDRAGGAPHVFAHNMHKVFTI